MRKVVIKKPGSYDRLEIQEAAKPTLGPRDVLIETAAIGVNFADCCVRMGVYASAKVYVGWPITPGFEVAGVAVETGSEVSSIVKGDKVIGLTRFGGYATHLSVPENQVFPLPKDWSFEQGAAFPTIFLTAYYALFELAHPRPGQTLLIHSAAGGVGSALAQLGRLAKCRTIGIVGAAHKVDQTKTDIVIDKSSQNLWNEVEAHCPKGCGIILDPNGAETLKESYHHLSAGGKLVVYGFHTMLSKGLGRPNWLKVAWDYLKTPRFNPLYMTSDNHSVLAFNLSFLFDESTLLREAMDTILSWAGEGKVILPAITQYSFENVAEAHRHLESGQSTGKIILIV